MKSLNSDLKGIKFLDLDCKGIKFLEEDIEYIDELSYTESVGLNYIFMKKEDTHTNPYENHKEIAIAGMLRIKKLICETILRNIADSDDPDDIKEIEMIKNGHWPFFMVEINEEKMLSEKITCSTFWEEKSYYKKQRPDGREYGLWSGYKEAYFNPIHGSTRQEVFNIINSKYLSPFNDENLEIYSWNDDWSNYFDSGKEYWGTFYWTIYNKEKGIYIVIGGSETD